MRALRWSPPALVPRRFVGPISPHVLDDAELCGQRFLVASLRNALALPEYSPIRGPVLRLITDCLETAASVDGLGPGILTGPMAGVALYYEGASRDLCHIGEWLLGNAWERKRWNSPNVRFVRPLGEPLLPMEYQRSEFRILHVSDLPLPTLTARCSHTAAYDTLLDRSRQTLRETNPQLPEAVQQEEAAKLAARLWGDSLARGEMRPCALHLSSETEFNAAIDIVFGWMKREQSKSAVVERGGNDTTSRLASRLVRDPVTYYSGSHQLVAGAEIVCQAVHWGVPTLPVVVR